MKASDGTTIEEREKRPGSSVHLPRHNWQDFEQSTAVAIHRQNLVGDPVFRKALGRRPFECGNSHAAQPQDVKRWIDKQGNAPAECLFSHLCARRVSLRREKAMS